MLTNIVQPTHLIIVLPAALLILGPNGSPKPVAPSAKDSRSSKAPSAAPGMNLRIRSTQPLVPRRSRDEVPARR